jgi:hypothetical protein
MCAQTAPTSSPQALFVQVVMAQELPIAPPSQGVVLLNTPLNRSSAQPAAARVAGFVVLLVCPLGPIPRAARSLSAVLARSARRALVVTA